MTTVEDLIKKDEAHKRISLSMNIKNLALKKHQLAEAKVKIKETPEWEKAQVLSSEVEELENRIETYMNEENQDEVVVKGYGRAVLNSKAYFHCNQNQKANLYNYLVAKNHFSKEELLGMRKINPNKEASLLKVVFEELYKVTPDSLSNDQIQEKIKDSKIFSSGFLKKTFKFKEK